MQIKNRKILGILLMISPPMVLVAVLIAWSLIAVLIPVFAVKSGGAGLVFVGKYINVILGVIGLLCVVLIPIGFVTGLILLLKESAKKQDMNQNSEKEIYNKNNSNAKI